MKKYILSLVLCCFMLCTGSVQAFAIAPSAKTPSIESIAISPLMDYIVQADGSIYIDSNGVATVKSSVYGYQGTTTRVEISAKLQQYKGGQWVTLKTFTTESNTHRTSLSSTYSVTKGYTYRVQATIRAYSGSSIETQTVTSSEANY